MTDRDLIQTMRMCAGEKACLTCHASDECEGVEHVMISAAGRLEALLDENERLKAGKDMNVHTEWVSVKDRLPENYERVLALCKDDVIHDMRWDLTRREWHGRISGNSYFEEFVTSWVTLPKLPSTERVKEDG